jgi:hypothetical protein
MHVVFHIHLANMIRVSLITGKVESAIFWELSEMRRQ